MNFSFPGTRSLKIALLTVSLLSANAGLVSQAQSVANAGAAVLPNGQQPVSQLKVGDAQLAIDRDGTLFRHDDHGKQWRAVHQQWAGKAVELLGIPALTEAPGRGAAARQPGDPTYVAVLLRSTTSLHWVSLDQGKTWSPSTLDDVRRNDVKWSGE